MVHGPGVDPLAKASASTSAATVAAAAAVAAASAAGWPVCCPLDNTTAMGPSSAAGASASAPSKEQSAARLQAHAREESRSQLRRRRAAWTIQAYVLKRQAYVLKPDLRIARAYADSLRPRDQAGNLYTTYSRVEWAVYDDLGANIGLYMRFLWWGLQISGALAPTTALDRSRPSLPLAS